MDFNDIQSAWNNDKSENVILPTYLQKLQSANMPLDKIRKNLKKELVYQIFSILFLGSIPVICHFSPLLQTAFYGLFVLFLVTCGYFLVKLYWFYKRLNKVETNTKDNLYDTYFDVRLNMELYKSFTYSLVPFVLVFVGMIFLNNYTVEQLTVLIHEKSADFFLGLLMGVFLGMMVCLGSVTEWWVNNLYGKYAKELRKVLDELKEE
ncbi:hypothetical protein [Flavobacterium sp. GT3R68]|uniref:hypothetical protein n=1 Tax=Flavobacterium sp. GT3R68 TaxID=2594437 RepID=UPI000F87214B|nr:hypothetical protein [Flavobacterium sp. GT3R68]RTY90866.1 hypothetical protein EKL32_20260 [Flavobacterium sp. GSN2]TRW93859.1 hypothetical protein FNW07_02820 [Flavobacterium sp. GT3R68]